jgi:hypothetical protein
VHDAVCPVHCQRGSSSGIKFSVFAWLVTVVAVEHGSRRPDKLSRLSSVVFDLVKVKVILDRTGHEGPEGA